MSSFSHSGPVFTENHEKEEAEDIDDEEKEIILDDMYGRQEVSEQEANNNVNNNNNNNDNHNGRIDDDGNDHDDDDDYDITDELIEQFNQILDETSNEEKKEYMEAIEMASSPYVIDVESDPKRFLRAEEYDPDMAVSRLIEYWKLRVEIFGSERAFKPITLDGALHDDISVIRAILQHPTTMRTLPNDAYGRAVFCNDKTNVSYKDLSDQIILVKILWFVLHETLRKQPQQSQIKGIVFLCIERKFDWDFMSRPVIKIMARSMDDTIPIKVKCVHLCTSSLFIQLMLPVIKFFMSRETRQRIQLHASNSTTTILNALQAYGLYRCNLPITMGGMYEEKPYWINDCIRIMNEYQDRHHGRSKRQRSL